VKELLGAACLQKIERLRAPTQLLVDEVKVYCVLLLCITPSGDVCKKNKLKNDL
jgi:hypothetical protein